MSRSSPLTVLKLGGSVITEKHQKETLDEGGLARSVTALGGIDSSLVLVHGAGSFGHHYAEKHGVSVTEGTDDPGAIRDIHRSMIRLNGAVMDALSDEGIRAVSVHPHSAAYRDDAGSLTLRTDVIDRMLGEDIVPVMYGDVITQSGKGMTVISGDEIVASLARSLGADRVGLCSTEAGVLDQEGDVIPRIESFGDVADVLGASEATDVTGGMAAKVQTMLELPMPATIFSLSDLEGFVAGETVGTRIGGSAPADRD